MNKQKQSNSAASPLQVAISHHQAGRLEQADALYKKIRNSPDAVNLQGVIAYQTGKFDKAVELIRSAIRSAPGNPSFHYNLGLAYRALERNDEALAAYRKAVALKPDYADAHNNLGTTLQDQGKLAEAGACYQKVIALQPGYVQAYSNLGSVFKDQGDFTQAEAYCRKALELNPDYAEALSNLGGILKEQGRYDEAMECSRKALTLNPASVDAHNNLGNALEEKGELAEAIACYEAALAIRSDRSESHFNLGSALRAQGKPKESIPCFERALQINPDFAEAANNLGIALLGLGHLDQAIIQFRHALVIKPDYANACNNLGIALLGQGKLDEAIAHYRQAIQIQPGLPNAYSNLLFAHNYHPSLSAEQIFGVYRDWNEQQAAQFSRTIAPFTNAKDPQRPLRIGYLSPDFNAHSVIHFVRPLIELHDKANFELHCYYNRFHYDANTVQIMASTDYFVPCLGMSDDELAARIRADGIDILVDLAGHTEGNRLMVFARKPAPIQASWLGFGYTTGLSTMDYFIGDKVFTPPGCEHLFSEKIFRLPHAAWTYLPPAAAPEPVSSPAARKGYVTFACTGRSERINQRMIETWATILRRLPTARLRLDSKNFGDQQLRAATEARFTDLGVDPGQLQFGFTSPVWDVYQDVDIVLDCFPHNSGTTTYEALWMGIPVITLADRPSVGRLGASILSCVGHPEWIASDSADYIERAVALAQDLPQLEQARAELRPAMQASPLLDRPGFVRDMENAYRTMWQTWCADAPQDAPSASPTVNPAPASPPTFETALAHHQAGRLQQAEAIYLTLPDNADAVHLLGVIASQVGQNAVAVERISQAIRMNPASALYYCNLGSAYQGLQQLDEAVASFDQALALAPEYPLALNNRGNALKDLGRGDQAIASFRKALRIKPDYVEALSNLGSALRDLGQIDEAIACFRQAIGLRPQFPEGHFNLGNAYSAQGRLHAAIDSFQAALASRPDLFRAQNNLGLAYKDQGKLDEAIACFRNALAVQPDFVEANSNLLFCHNYHPTLPAERIFEVYREWNAHQAAPLAIGAAPFANSCSAGTHEAQRRLRIGYVSADFHNHSVIHFAGPVIEHHDKTRFEVFCYANQGERDAFTERMMTVADHWIPCRMMSDEQLAQRIRADGIDILVDLSGHTLGHRLLTFARRAAPVQASWLGFGYTTGLSAMDYFIGDPVFTPPGCEALFSETVYRLPHCFAAFQAPAAAPEPGASPARRKGYVTFACLSRRERMNAGVIETWSAILKRLPAARLRLDSRNFLDADARRDMEAAFAVHGIAATQLEIGFTSPVWTVYQDVDIVLDCFPHNSGTTTYEALWMGSPVVTLADRPSVGRIGASILSAIGRPEWIAGDRADYVERAVALAQDTTALAATRASLRDAMRRSPLMQQAAFTRNMEDAYRAMWANWCANQSDKGSQS